MPWAVTEIVTCTSTALLHPVRRTGGLAESGDYSTWVAVYCPPDVERGCEGTITVKVTGHKLGPERFPGPSWTDPRS